MFHSRSSILFKTPLVARQFSCRPIVRWAAFFQKELPFLKYLKNSNFHDNYTTGINEELLNRDFGDHTYSDFFGPNAKVDLARLYYACDKNLNEVEKRQNSAMKKELDRVINILNFRLDLGKAIHERNSEQLKSLMGNNSSTFNVEAWIDYFKSKKNLYEYISQLPPASSNEITLISDYEFAHYPFLAPFKFENLSRITAGVREKLQNMPDNFAGILGSIPVALNDREAKDMGIMIDTHHAEKHSLYLFNISIVVTGHGVIMFVPKLVKSTIDIRYPIVKYVMYDGNVYPPAAQAPKEGQSHQTFTVSAPTAEERANYYPHYTDIPLVNLDSPANKRITKMTIGGGIVHIIPEICLENAKGKAVKLWNTHSEDLFKKGSFTKKETHYILHVLIASGAPAAKTEDMAGSDLFVHDRTLGVTYIKGDKEGTKTEAYSSSTNNTEVNLAIFEPRSLRPTARLKHKDENWALPSNAGGS